MVKVRPVLPPAGSVMGAWVRLLQGGLSPNKVRLMWREHEGSLAYSTWLPSDCHQYQKNPWKLEDQQRYMTKYEDSCLTSMKKSLDTCISSEQCLVSDEFIMKHIQEEIIQEENGEVMGLDPPITWMKQYENGRPKELILPISEDRRPKQRWAYIATGYGGPLLKVQYYALVLENGEYVTRDIFPTIMICQESKSKGVHQYRDFSNHNPPLSRL
ncbi:hypothetical protein E3N88_28896 [Mikania micrantha]|uniref:Uncharacterized protein n=1 Tax=Mikania micrantha TaxID=192012 RepID=A0A5N6N3K7_9ASTR|nr:hypothetical protein E3N88_28896 [Mikania micrantha]